MKIKKLARQLSHSHEREPMERVVQLDSEEGYAYGDHTRRGPNPYPDEDNKKGKGLFANPGRGSFRKINKKANMEKEALSLDDYGLVIKTAGERKGLYPIATPEQHVEVQIFFSSKHAEMDPKYRHELATKLAAKMEVDPSIPKITDFDKYAGTEFSPTLHHEIHARKDFLLDKGQRCVYDVLYEKRAALGPRKFADYLSEIDREFGLDQQWDIGINDPYSSTFKTAGQYTESYVWDSGSERVTGLEIKKLAEEPSLLAGYLTPEIIGAFQKDPIDIFESLPSPQKMLVLRAAKGDLAKREAAKVASEDTKPDMNTDTDAIARGEDEVKKMPDALGNKPSEAHNPKKSDNRPAIDSNPKVANFLAQKLSSKGGISGAFRPVVPVVRSRHKIKAASVKERLMNMIGAKKLPAHIAKLEPKDQAEYYRKKYMRKMALASEEEESEDNSKKSDGVERKAEEKDKEQKEKKGRKGKAKDDRKQNTSPEDYKEVTREDDDVSKEATSKAHRSGLVDVESSYKKHMARGVAPGAATGAGLGAVLGLLKGRGIAGTVVGAGVGAAGGAASKAIAHFLGRDKRHSNAFLNAAAKTPQKSGESDLAWIKRVIPGQNKSLAKPGEIPDKWRKKLLKQAMCGKGHGAKKKLKRFLAKRRK